MIMTSRRQHAQVVLFLLFFRGEHRSNPSPHLTIPLGAALRPPALGEISSLVPGSYRAAADRDGRAETRHDISAHAERWCKSNTKEAWARCESSAWFRLSPRSREAPPRSSLSAARRIPLLDQRRPDSNASD